MANNARPGDPATKAVDVDVDKIVQQIDVSRQIDVAIADISSDRHHALTRELRFDGNAVARDSTVSAGKDELEGQPNLEPILEGIAAGISRQHKVPSRLRRL